MAGSGEDRLSRFVINGEALLTVVDIDGKVAVTDLVVFHIKPVGQVVLHLSDSVLDAHGIASHLADLHPS